MFLDRRKAFEIAQALSHARINKSKDDALKNVTPIVIGHGTYSVPSSGNARYSPTSQPGVKTVGEAGSTSHELAPIHSFQRISGPAKLPLAGEDVDIANVIHGRQAGLNGGDSTENKPIGGYAASKATDLTKYPATDTAGTSETTVFKYPMVDKDAPRRLLWKHYDNSNANPPGNPTAIPRLAGDGLHTGKDVPGQENEMPEVRHVTTGDVWWGFWGGIGKGIAQAIVDGAIDGAVAHRAARGGVYHEVEKPDLFGPPTNSWDDTGRKIAPGIMNATGPRLLFREAPRKIGKIRLPKDLKPGTVPFGNYMHEEISKLVQSRHPKTIFHFNIKPGQRGVDVHYVSGPDPGFKHLDIKTDKPHSQKQLNRQIQNWGHDESKVRAITYDEDGNVFFGFGD